jgi:hypothetical protein
MRRRVLRSTFLLISAVILILLVLRPSTSRDKGPVHWAAYYAGALPPGGFSGFQLLVLDSDSHPPLAPLHPGRKLLGYISIGEAEQTREYFDRIKTQGLFAGENENWPGSLFAVNRGYSILPRIDRSIDYVLGESVRADYDFAAKTYRRVPEEPYSEQVATLKAAKARNPKLTVLTLDYWNPGDASGIKRIYEEERGNGFIPYVATLKLDQLVEEPR